MRCAAIASILQEAQSPALYPFIRLGHILHAGAPYSTWRVGRPITPSTGIGVLTWRYVLKPQFSSHWLCLSYLDLLVASLPTWIPRAKGILICIGDQIFRQSAHDKQRHATMG